MITFEPPYLPLIILAALLLLAIVSVREFFSAFNEPQTANREVGAWLLVLFACCLGLINTVFLMGQLVLCVN
jgi:hypothetical protein